MATTADIRNGLCIELNNDILRVIDFQRFQVGRGSGKVWTKLKSSTTGKVLEHTFQSGHNITEVRVERVAPLGDPIQFRLHGYRLALRKSEARRVLVMAR